MRATRRCMAPRPAAGAHLTRAVNKTLCGSGSRVGHLGPPDRWSGPGLAQVVVVDQHLDGQAIVTGRPGVEGHGRHAADVMAVLPGQPAQVSDPAAVAVDPRW